MNCTRVEMRKGGIVTHITIRDHEMTTQQLVQVVNEAKSDGYEVTTTRGIWTK